MTAMNLFETYSARVASALAALAERGALPAGLDLGRVVVEPTKDPAHGDLATNAAMVLAKEAGTNPRALAGLLVEELARQPDIVSAEIAGPGFINLRLDPAVFTAILKAAVETGTEFGRGSSKGDTKINVEYVSANPTGPMHVGHGRGAVFGDSLASLLAFAGPRRHPRVLHQRCRRAGRRARQLGLPALTAKRWAKRSARSRRGSIPATT